MEIIEIIEKIVNIIQGIVIISATLFTSWWAYKTFAHKERISELKKILNLVEIMYREGKKNVKAHDFDGALRRIEIPVTLNATILSSLYIEERDRVEIFKLNSKFNHDYMLLINEKNKKSIEERLSHFQLNYEKVSLKLFEISKKYI